MGPLRLGTVVDLLGIATRWPPPKKKKKKKKREGAGARDSTRGRYTVYPSLQGRLQRSHILSSSQACRRLSRYPTDRDKSRKQAVGDWEAISTPLQVEEWARILAEHPNTQFAALVTDGLRRGFRIGFDRGHKLRSACSNLKGARDHPEVVDAYIAAECRAGTVLGPFDPALLPAVHISKFGVIPKPHRPGEWRLIVDLSAPFGESVNDGISCYRR